MSNVDPFYYSMESLQQTIWAKDATGPLAGGIVSFFSDPAFSVQKDVFQESNYPNNPTFVNIGAVLTLSNIGSFVDGGGNNFIPTLYPWSIPEGQPGAPGEFQPYFITVYSADGILQFTVDGWPQNSFSISPESSTLSGTQNLLINPQFSEVSFTPNPATGSAVFTVNGTMDTPIAPGWSIHTTGSGTVTVKQLSLNIQTPGDAAYAIDIAFSAAVQGSLRQIISNSPRLLQGDFASGYLEAASSGSSHVPLNITMTFTPSTGTMTGIFSGDQTGTDSFEALSGTSDTAIASLNTDNANGFVTIAINIPVGVEVSITNVQLVGVADSTVVPAFIQSSTLIQNSHVFGYWQPALNFKPIPSLLTGWDFPLNPAQLGLQNITATPAYIADQTIAASVGGNFSSGVDTSGGFNFTSTAANSSFYLLQYLTAPEALKVIGSPLSCNLFAWASTANVVATVTMLVGSSIPLLSASPPTPVTMTSDGIISQSSATGWVYIPNQNTPSNYAITSIKQVTVENQINTGTDYSFNGWQVTDSGHLSTLTTYAIIVSFSLPTLGSTVTVNSISCVPGNIPTRPALQTPDEVLRECQYYYERSWPAGIPTGTATYTNSVVLSQGAVPQITLSVGAIMHLTYFFNQEAFGLVYKQTKRIAVTPVFYSTLTANTPNVVTAYLAWQSTEVPGGNSSRIDTTLSGSWTVTGTGTQAFSYNIIPGNLTNSIIAAPQQTVGGSSFYYASANMSFHYICDARLGIV